jgi:hypothetical protein
VECLDRDYCQWTHHYWWCRYSCWIYWCPSRCCWYYWYEDDGCYYPISYIETATPVVEDEPKGCSGRVTQIVNVTNNAPGSRTTVAPEPPEDD